jgi:hypothetical protein
MSQIVAAASLPKGDFYITDVPFYNRIKPEKLEDFFAAAEPVGKTLAELLLKNPCSAIYHLNKNDIGHLGERTFVVPLFMGENFLGPCCDGSWDYIAVQDVQKRIGPWVFYDSIDPEGKSFHLQAAISPVSIEAKFMDEAGDPSRISRRFLHKGNPLEIFEAFKALGFVFIDKPMSKEYAESIGF